MRYRLIAGITFGTVLACAGGSALGIAIWLYGGGHRMSEPALESIGMMFGLVAFVFLAIADFLFIWVYWVYKEAKRYRSTGISEREQAHYPQRRGTNQNSQIGT